MGARTEVVDLMTPTSLLLGFIVAVGAAAFGIVALLRLARGRPAFPARSLRPRIDPTRVRGYATAAVVGVLVLVLTRWPLAGVAACVLVLLGPRVLGGAAVGRRQLATIEAIAAWTESLRDTAGAAAGLEQAIPATVSAAHPLLARPLRLRRVGSSSSEIILIITKA